jgi:hypothetical protein
VPVLRLHGANEEPAYAPAETGLLTVSLLRFLAEPDVAAKIKPLRPKLPRKIPATLKVQPRSNRFMTVGTAFDYLLRFELQRRAPHAVAGRWVA